MMVSAGERPRIGRIELRRQEIASRRAECVDNRAHARFVAIANRHQFAEARRSSHRVARRRSLGQRPEYGLGYGAAVIAESAQHFVGVGIERAAESADALVIGEREHDRRVGRVVPGARPHAVEAVLQQRQLIGAASEAIELIARAAVVPRRERGEIVEQPVGQLVLDLEAADRGRPDDGAAALLAASCAE